MLAHIADALWPCLRRILPFSEAVNGIHRPSQPDSESWGLDWDPPRTTHESPRGWPNRWPGLPFPGPSHVSVILFSLPPAGCSSNPRHVKTTQPIAFRLFTHPMTRSVRSGVMGLIIEIILPGLWRRKVSPGNHSVISILLFYPSALCLFDTETAKRRCFITIYSSVTSAGVSVAHANSLLLLEYQSTSSLW